MIAVIEDLRERLLKVDHPPKGSKDVTDAVAGAVWMATQMIAGEGEIMFV